MKTGYQVMVGLLLTTTVATFVGCSDASNQTSSQVSPLNTNVSPNTNARQAPPTANKQRRINMSVFSDVHPHIPKRFSEAQLRGIYELELGANDAAEAEQSNSDKYQGEVQHYFGLTNDENMGLSMEADDKGYMKTDMSKDFSTLFINFRKHYILHHRHSY